MGRAESALKSQEKALEILTEFMRDAEEACRRNGLKLIEAYLVGSRARGDYTEESDIDIILVIEGVENMNMLQRLTLFKETLKPRIDLKIYTQREWESDLTWIKQVREEAKLIREAIS